MPHIFAALDWAVGAFIVRDGRVLLLHHRALGCWLPPGGHVEVNECPVAAVHREVREETGLEIEIGLWRSPSPHVKGDGVVSLPPPDWFDRHRISPTHWHLGLFWVAVLKNPDTEPILREPAKHLALEWCDPAALPNPIWPATALYAAAAVRLVASSRFVETE